MDNGGFELRAKVKAETQQGALYGIGVIEGYCPHPQVLITRPDGTSFWWRADMVKALEEETVRIMEFAGVEFEKIEEGE